MPADARPLSVPAALHPPRFAHFGPASSALGGLLHLAKPTLDPGDVDHGPGCGKFGFPVLDGLQNLGMLLQGLGIGPGLGESVPDPGPRGWQRNGLQHRGNTRLPGYRPQLPMDWGPGSARLTGHWISGSEGTDRVLARG